MLLEGKERATQENPRRVILNTDANNEIDDQMAIVHALLSPELKIEGIVAAHYGKKKDKNSLEKSYEEILHLLKLMDMEDEVTVVKGAAEAMKDHNTPQKSEGAEFTIERALAEDEDDPLYVPYLGPITDMASAYLMEPKIAENTITQWIGGGWWPNGGPEFNCGNDWIAGDVMFQSEMPLIQYSRATYRMMRVGVAEMERYVMGKGAIGDYLTAIFKQWRINSPEPRTWWVYGDSPAIGTLINPDWGCYTTASAPRINEDLMYEHVDSDYDIELCVEVTAGEIFDDFYEKLDQFSRKI